MEFHLYSFVYGLVAGGGGVGAWWWWLGHKAKARQALQTVENVAKKL